jgi:hypothetical protein
MNERFQIRSPAQDLVRRARLIAGIDIVDEEIQEPLARLLHSLNEEAALTRAGSTAMEQRILRILCNRLRMLRDYQTHPEIFDQQISRPLLLTGAGRTGSTKTQKLLAATGDFKFLPFWQGYSFALRSGRREEDTAERIRDAADYIDWFDTHSPQSRSTHAFGIFEPEEETIILEHDNFGLWISQFANVPSFAAWYTERGFRAAFQFLRRGLQYLQWQFHDGDQRPWVLKCPVYFGMEPLLAETFPDAVFVATHRNPLNTLPSAASTMENFLRAYSDRDFKVAIKHMVMQALTAGTNKFMTWRAEKSFPSILDVSYRELTSDSGRVVAKIYEYARLTKSAAVDKAIEEWEARNTQHRMGVHEYSAGKYSMDPTEIESELTGYIESYKEFF